MDTGAAALSVRVILPYLIKWSNFHHIDVPTLEETLFLQVQTHFDRSGVTIVPIMEITLKVKWNFSGSNTFGTMKICSRQR